MRTVLIPALALSLTTSLLTAANWPQWRGPNFDGSSPETDLPTKFSKTENVKWTADLPGPAASTPVIWNDHVFVSTTHLAERSLLAMALNRGTGKVIWQKNVSPGFDQDRRSNYASPSPATDGQTVVFFYGNGELVAYNFAGDQIWTRNIQKDYGSFAFQWTFSTSPVLHDGRLYLQVLQRDEAVGGRGNRGGPNDSYLLALDPKTGKELWKVSRPSEARAESLEAFTTPIPFTHEGREELLIAGGDCLTGHDPDTGRELWRWGTWNPTRIGHWRLVPSPVAASGTILACAPKAAPVYAVKAGLKGTQDDSALRWKSSDRAVSSDVSTPLSYKGAFYVINSDRKSISRVDPKSGDIKWTGELAGPKLEGSPTGADDKIYVMNHAGTVFVVGTGDTFELLHQADFGGPDDRELRATLPVAHGNLFIRTDDKLYCIGK